MLVFSVWPRRFFCAVTAALVVPYAFAPAAASGAEHQTDAVVVRYADALNHSLPTPVRLELAERVILLSSYYRLDPRLLIALVTVESGWHSRALSPVGARGLGQLMPGTAAALDVDAFETYENLDGTARYLRRLLNRFPRADERSRYRFALAAYNAGPGAVAKYGGVPPYAETRSYVTNVLAIWEGLTRRVDVPDGRALAAIRPQSAPPARARVAVAPRHAVASAALPQVDVPVSAPRTSLHLAPIARYTTAAIALPVLRAENDAIQRPRVKPLLAWLRERRSRSTETPQPEPATETIAPATPAALPTLARHVARAAAHPVPKRTAAAVVPRHIILRAPQHVAEGEGIPVEVSGGGKTPIVLVAKVGPTILDRRSLLPHARHIVLKAPRIIHESTVVMVRAYGAGYVSGETMVVTVPQR